MNTTRRRTVASLTFIAFMAVILAVIILVGSPRNSSAIPQATVADTIAADATATTPDSTAIKAKAKKKLRKKKSEEKVSRRKSAIAPDNPDIFDTPVEHTRR